MTPQDLTIDIVTDNGDNSITITGHHTNNISYTTGDGRKSDAPDPANLGDASNLSYYQEVLAASVPQEPVVVYQAPDYTPPTTE